jgi:hypothetical protein
MNIVMPLGTQQKGLLIGLMKKFEADGHCVYLQMLKPGLARYFENVYGISQNKIVDFTGTHLNKVSYDKIIEKVVELEQKYGVLFNGLIAQDRGLGRGYLLNIEKYPNRFDAWISYNEKLKVILDQFLQLEYIVEKYTPDLFVQIYINPVQQHVTEYMKIPSLSVGLARCSNRVILYSNSHLQSFSLESFIHSNLENDKVTMQYNPKSIERNAVASKTHSKTEWSYFNATKNSSILFLKELKSLAGKIFSSDKRTGYYPFAWVPSRFREVRNYRTVLNCGVTPKDIKDFKFVYFPLHLEPELSLMSVSPEFGNSLEAISWISKSLPANYLLVIREHTLSYGNRSKAFYNFLRQISNVKIAHPLIHAWKWIDKADFVATITGSVGYEGVLLRKPVLSYGKHQAINALPTVGYASDFCSTKKAVGKLISKTLNNQKSLELSHKVLAQAIEQASFELPGFVSSFAKEELQPIMAQILYEQVMKVYPEAKKRLE